MITSIRQKDTHGSIPNELEIASSIESLPDELMIKIFLILDVLGCSAASKTCIRWNVLSRDDSIWQAYIQKDFPHCDSLRDFFIANEPQTLTKEQFKSKRTYQHHYFCSRNLVKGVFATNNKINQINKKIYNPITFLVTKDRKFISTSAEDVIISDLKTDTILETFKEHKATVVALALYKKMLITGDKRGLILRWDLEKKSSTKINILPLICPNALICTKDARLILGFINGMIAIISHIDTKPLTESPLYGHTEDITALAMDTNEQLLVSASKDLRIKIWNLKESICLNTIETSFASGNFPTKILVTKTNQIVAGFVFGMIETFDLENGSYLDVFPINDTSSQVTALALTPQGYLFSGFKDGSIKFFDLNKFFPANSLKEMNFINEMRFPIKSLVFTEDGELILGDTTGVKVFNFMASEKEIFQELATIFKEFAHSAKVMASHLNEPIKKEIALERFQHMPERARNKINEEVFKIFKSNSSAYYKPSRKFLKYSITGQLWDQATMEQKSQAIMNYLSQINFSQTT